MLNQTKTLQGPRRQETPCCYDGRRSGKANWREWKACGFESLSGSSSKLDSVHDRFPIWYKSFSMVEKRIIYQSQRGFLQETGSCSPNWPLNALNIATAFERWVRCLCEGFAQWLQGWSTTGSTKRSKGSDGAGWHVRCRAAVKTSQLTLCIFVHWTLTWTVDMLQTLVNLQVWCTSPAFSCLEARCRKGSAPRVRLWKLQQLSASDQWWRRSSCFMLPLNALVAVEVTHVSQIQGKKARHEESSASAKAELRKHSRQQFDSSCESCPASRVRKNVRSGTKCCVASCTVKVELQHPKQFKS